MSSFLHLNLGNTLLQPSLSTQQHNPFAKDSQQCYIHPVVLFSILDHYLRRNSTQDNVIGTLLGIQSDDGRVVEVRSCFAVPHFENEEQVEMDMDYHHQMYQLHSRVNQKEVIVGWYSTGKKLSKYAPLIHDFYTKQATAVGGARATAATPTTPAGMGLGQQTTQPTTGFSPVHLVVDTDMTDNQLGIQAYVASLVGTEKNPENSIFLPISYEVQYPNAERSALDVISKAKDAAAQGGDGDPLAPLVADMDHLEVAIKQLVEMLDRVSSYVQRVCDGVAEPNNVVGKYLVDMLSYVPRIDASQFEGLFQTHLQDLLMIVYLSNLTRAQLDIADRLQRIM
ncbi:hypothetical protein EV182_000559 [Spiromyces aspiralis]|uniref:Uncharacterized protein n=1 Tax=Spiromyces aspiralis TaxID=68401 RepID=A0ACC1HV13_9FUNG|nr:hypothetical protein EV182_000559 [Spiromyces aspiralis]